MISYIEALVALEQKKTMTRAALSLHVSQSAISKRIQRLEEEVGQKLIQRVGRRVELTNPGKRLVESSLPILSELKSVLQGERAEGLKVITVALSSSVLLDGGASRIGKIQKKFPNIDLKLSIHHASVALELVRSGERMLAIIQGDSSSAKDLKVKKLYDQNLVIIPSGLKEIRLEKSNPVEFIGLEDHTEAWKFIKKGIFSLKSKITLEKTQSLQGFSAIVEMAKAGFGHGLAPEGVAKTLGIKKPKLLSLPNSGIKIPVSIFSRQTTSSREGVQEFSNSLVQEFLR